MGGGGGSVFINRGKRLFVNRAVQLRPAKRLNASCLLPNAMQQVLRIVQKVEGKGAIAIF